MSELISIFDPAQVEQLRKSCRLDPQDVRVMRNRLLKQFRPDQEALRDFAAADRVRCHTLALFRRLDSHTDGATKLLFRTAAGLLIETVILRIASGRTTLCVSSQVGCAAACDFCATGRMGIARNLAVDEILDQVLQAGQLIAGENRRLDNIVFMGMGEPFHNQANLFAAIQQLTATDHFNRSPGSILVSTVGVAEGMVSLAEQFPAVNLALSLHSVEQTTRQSIIPLGRRYPLDQLKETLVKCQQLQGRETMIEYLMLRELNDSIADADRLVQWLGGVAAHVNLIPYNRIEDAPHLVGSDREQVARFAGRLKASGVKTTIRYSLGRDIAAACGQLVRRENRALPTVR